MARKHRARKQKRRTAPGKPITRLATFIVHLKTFSEHWISGLLPTIRVGKLWQVSILPTAMETWDMYNEHRSFSPNLFLSTSPKVISVVKPSLSLLSEVLNHSRARN